MAGLSLNPIGDLGGSLGRIEGAVHELRAEIGDVSALPDIHRELEDIRKSLHKMIELMEGLRADLAVSPALKG